METVVVCTPSHLRLHWLKARTHVSWLSKVSDHIQSSAFATVRYHPRLALSIAICAIGESQTVCYLAKIN